MRCNRAHCSPIIGQKRHETRQPRQKQRKTMPSIPIAARKTLFNTVQECLPLHQTLCDIFLWHACIRGHLSARLNGIYAFGRDNFGRLDPHHMVNGVHRLLLFGERGIRRFSAVRVFYTRSRLEAHITNSSNTYHNVIFCHRSKCEICKNCILPPTLGHIAGRQLLFIWLAWHIHTRARARIVRDYTRDCVFTCATLSLTCQTPNSHCAVVHVCVEAC